MDNYLEELYTEQQYLEKVLNLVKSELELETDNIKSRKEKLLFSAKEMWENSVHFSTDFDKMTEVNQYLADMTTDKASLDFTLKRIEYYKKLLNTPYFGRFDFIEEGSRDQEKFYIGINTVKSTKTQEILVYDWRAPISSIYYRYEPGEAEYDTPYGRCSGRVILKRQYKIRNSGLKYFLDSEIRIRDEILQEVLSQNSSPKMKNIIQTIQKEQDVIIRDKDSELLIVQGMAGSGKTSVALHRIAYLLYEGLNSYKSNNIIIISPNPVFGKYISEVLPELGEENVEQITFDDLFLQYTEDKLKSEKRYQQLEALIACKNQEERDYLRRRLEFKGSREFVKILNRLIYHYEHQMLRFDDIYYFGILIENRQLLKNDFLNNKINMPVAKRLKRLENKMYAAIEPIQKNKLLKLEKIIQSKKEHEFDYKVFSRLISIKSMKYFTDKFKKLTETDYFSLYKQLFIDRKLFGKLSEGIYLPEDFVKMSQDTVVQLFQKIISYEDTLPLLYLRLRLEGSEWFTNKRQVVIDEAQDYFPIQYEIYKLVFPEANFTVLGDINQTIEKEGTLSLYDDISEIINKRKALKLFLNNCYRSSCEIDSFNRKLLKMNQSINSFERHEEKPEILYSDTDEAMNTIALEKVKEYVSHGFETIAIICKTELDTNKVYMDLRGNYNIRKLEIEDEFKKGIVILPVYMSKGLEFDAVIVYGASSINYSDEFDRKLLYIACTRALHRLSVIYSGPISPFIEID